MKSRSPSPSLHRLIQSLTQTEKRYFKLHTNKEVNRQDAIYLQLFEVMEAQNRPDEAAIQEGLPHLSPSRLPNVKNYLERTILKSLGNYYQDSSIDAKMQFMLGCVRILYSKALLKEAVKKLKKAKKLAYRHERFPVLFELLRWERKMSGRHHSAAQVEKALMESLAEERKVLALMQNVGEISERFYRVYIRYVKNGVVRTPDQKLALDALMDHEILKDPDRALTFQAKILQNNTWFIYYESIGKSEQGFGFLKNMAKLFADNPVFILDETRNYVSTLNNLLICQKELKLQTDFFSTLQTFRNLPKKIPKGQKEHIELLVFPRSYLLEMDYHLECRTFHNLPPIIEKLEKGLKQLETKIHKLYLIALQNKLALAWFSLGNHREALRWLNKTLNNSDVSLRPDVLSFARMFMLILHYELGNIDLLDHLGKSSYGYLFKKNTLYRSEKILLKFFSEKLPKLVTEAQRLKAFQNLKEKLAQHAETENILQTLSPFDFLEWIDDKIGASRHQKR